MTGKTVNLVLDTNVFISAVFFSGIPYRILDAWRKGRVRLFVSRAILAEYHETGASLAKEFKGVDVAPWIALLEAHATLVEPDSLPGQVCTDPDDDMFIACALAARAHIICSGDKALLKTSGYCGIEVLKPREFVDRYLPQTQYSRITNESVAHMRHPNRTETLEAVSIAKHLLGKVGDQLGNAVQD